MIGNREDEHSAFEQPFDSYHPMKFQIYIFDNEGAMTIQYFEL